MSAWVYLLTAKEFIHEGCEWTRSIARRRDWSATFWSADIYVGMGLVTQPLKNLSTKGANGQGVSLEANYEEAIEALFWSAIATNLIRCAFRSAY